ncbi:glycosyltransferase family 39 protein [Lentisphaerota bacterium ZTH]|nr:glycosyltransferase family 39 protein [Lentisphaerota bacterium]WET07063.1 glycosyltransferase family 39 protein [Lentisphaerota bacterium ZTH]
MSKRKRFYILLGVITLIALAVRLLACFEMQSCHNGLNPVNCPSRATDMLTYINLARSIAAGSFTGVFYYQPFYYAVFLPLIYLVFGTGIWPVIIIQALLGALTAGLTGLTGAMLWSRKAGLAAAVLTAFSQMLIFFTPFHMIVNLQAFWLTMILFLAVAAMRRKKFWIWCACALVTGFAILTRGNVWFLVPGILLAAWYSMWRDKSRSNFRFKAWLLPVVMFIMVLLPQLPFAWHNSRVLGKISGPSTAAGNVLALGNTPESPPGGRNPGLPAGPMEYPPTYYSWTADMQQVSVVTRIWGWIYQEPGAFLELTFRKLLLFWDCREIPNNVALNSNVGRTAIIKLSRICPSCLIIALALGAVFVLPALILRRRSVRLALLLYSIFAYWLATAAFYNLARFRAPLLPLLALLAGIFIMRFMQCRRTMKFGGAYLIFFPAVALGSFITFNSYDLYRGYVEASVMTWVRPNGVRVELAPEKTMYLDNGPLTFGGWKPLLLSSGTRISKRFEIEKGTPETSKADFELSLLFAKPGEVIVELNGKRFSFKSEHMGIISRRFGIPFNNTGLVELVILGKTGDIYCLLDQQRIYGRTLLSGKKEKAELVCRLFLTLPESATSILSAPSEISQ